MKKIDNDSYVLITGTANPKLANEIGKLLDKKVCNPITKFADREIRVQIQEPLFDKEVFIIQPTSSPVNNNFMELLLMIDAAKRGGANKINAIIPYFGYSRQDRKDQSRVPISSAVVSGILDHVGATRLITIDLHSEQQQGFFSGPWDNLYASYILIPELKKLLKEKIIVASPDKGGAPRANAYAKRLDADGIAIVYKERDTSAHNESKALDMIGYVRGKNVLLVDDMVDTAGTVVNAAKLIKERGAKRVLLATTHGLFSKNAIENLNSSPIEKVVITNTINQSNKVLSNKKIMQISIAPLITDVIKRNLEGGSLAEIIT